MLNYERFLTYRLNIIIETPKILVFVSYQGKYKMLLKPCIVKDFTKD